MHVLRVSQVDQESRPARPVAQGAWMLSGLLAFLACSLPLALAQAGTPSPGQPDPNLIPNGSLRGSFGAIGEVNGTVSGEVPTLWRAVSIDGAAMTLERQMLAPDTLFPGSPATEAVKITVSSFGVEQVFDHSNAMFPVVPGRSYGARLYVRSGNADNSPQSFGFNMPYFDAALDFFGRDPSAFTASASDAWAAFDSPESIALAGDAFAHIALRMIDDGGENSIILALPRVLGPPVGNLAPNPGFSGSSGAIDGMVNGSVPDGWRAFAVDDNSLTTASVPLAADTLYPGSPPTTAVRIEVSGGDGTFEGFDHEGTRVALSAPYRHWGEVYLRSGHAASQGVNISFPLFDATGTFAGQQPGSFVAEVGPEWSLYAGPAFFGDPSLTGNLAFRLLPSGAENSLLIALPRIVGPAGPLVFRDGFEVD